MINAEETSFLFAAFSTSNSDIMTSSFIYYAIMLYSSADSFEADLDLD